MYVKKKIWSYVNGPNARKSRQQVNKINNAGKNHFARNTKYTQVPSKKLSSKIQN